MINISHFCFPHLKVYTQNYYGRKLQYNINYVAQVIHLRYNINDKCNIIYFNYLLYECNIIKKGFDHRDLISG